MSELAESLTACCRSPVLIGWPLPSTIAGRLLMRVGYRPLALAGGFLQLAAVAWLALRVGPDLGTVELAAVMFVAGVTASGAIKAG